MCQIRNQDDILGFRKSEPCTRKQTLQLASMQQDGMDMGSEKAKAAMDGGLS